MSKYFNDIRKYLMVAKETQVLDFLSSVTNLVTW